MSNFKLVVGNAGPREESSVMDRLLRVQPRIYSTPKTKEYDLVMPSMSPIARLRRWRNRELGGPRVQMGLWLEASQFCACPPRQTGEPMQVHEAGCGEPPKGIRIDLRLTATPAPQRCRLVLVNDRSAQFWSYSTDETAFASIQLPEYVVYPSTSNYVGIVEWQWDAPFDPDRGHTIEPIEIGNVVDSGLFRPMDSSDFAIKSKLYSIQSGTTEMARSEYRLRRARW